MIAVSANMVIMIIMDGSRLPVMTVIMVVIITMVAMMVPTGEGRA